MSQQRKKNFDNHKNFTTATKRTAQENRIPKKDIEKGLDELIKYHGSAIKELARR